MLIKDLQDVYFPKGEIQQNFLVIMYSGRGLCRMGEFSWTKEFVASLQEYKAPFYTDLIKDYNIIRRVPLYFHKRILDIFRSTRDHCLRFCVHRTGRLITDQVVIKVKDKRWVCQQCLFAHISSKRIFNNKITKNPMEPSEWLQGPQFAGVVWG